MNNQSISVVSTKACSKCKENKPLNNFCKCKSAQDGLNKKCKKCCNQYNFEHKEENKIYQKRHYIEHKKEINLRQKLYYSIPENKERKNFYDAKYRLILIKASPCQIKKTDSERKEEKRIRSKQHHIEHREEDNLRNRKNKIKNKEKNKIYNDKYNAEHKDEINFKNREYYHKYKEEINLQRKQHHIEHKEEINSHRRNYHNHRRKTNPEVRIILNYRARINHAYKDQGVKKAIHTIEGLGCMVLKYQQHLQSHFKPGMTLKNNVKRKWVQHHLIELNSVDLNNIEQLKRVCHYTNIIPMWEDEHIEWHRTHPFIPFKKPTQSLETTTS